MENKNNNARQSKEIFNKSFKIKDDEIILFHYRIPEDINEEIIALLISGFSVSQQKELNNFQNKDAQKRKLFGRIMLKYTASKLGLNPDYLDYTSSGKPQFMSPSPYYFNISHSGNRVVYCITKDAQIGIDLEVIRPVNIEIYRNYFDLAEWQYITNSEHPEAEFLRLWVRKEAIIKAAGRGMDIELSSLHCMENTAKAEALTWHIQHMEISPDFLCAIACNKLKKVVELDFNTVITLADINRDMANQTAGRLL